MALRLKKLAKRLDRDPAEVLGLLHAVGFSRYKNANDMIADPAIRRVEQAIRDGVQPLPVQIAAPTASKSARQTPTRPDLMASLIPGIVPMKGGRAPAPRTEVPPTPVDPPAAPLAAVAAPASAAERVPETTPSGPTDRELELQARLRTLSDEVAALRGLSVEVDRLRTQLAAIERPPTLRAVLEARGLRGTDELERALSGLAKRRLLLSALGGVTVADGGQLAELLRSRVRLVDGPTPEGLPESLVAVSVAPERAEVLAESKLAAAVARVGEQMLLNGRRQLVAVGGDPLDLHLLAGRLDSRVRFFRGLEPAIEADSAVVLCWGRAATEVERTLVEQGALLAESELGLAPAFAAIDAALSG